MLSAYYAVQEHCGRVWRSDRPSHRFGIHTETSVPGTSSVVF